MTSKRLNKLTLFYCFLRIYVLLDVTIQPWGGHIIFAFFAVCPHTWFPVIISRRPGDYKTHSVRVCVTFLKRAIHHTGFSLAFSMFYDLIAYVFSFDAVFSDLGP